MRKVERESERDRKRQRERGGETERKTETERHRERRKRERGGGGFNFLCACGCVFKREGGGVVKACLPFYIAQSHFTSLKCSCYFLLFTSMQAARKGSNQ